MLPACYGWAFPGVHKLEHLVKMEHKYIQKLDASVLRYRISDSDKKGKNEN